MTSEQQPGPEEKTAADPGTRGGGADAPRRPRSPRVLVSVAAAVVIVAGGGTYLATAVAGGNGGTGGSSEAGGRPTPLVIGGLADDSASPGPAAPPVPAPQPGGERYRAAGALPDGPGSAKVYQAGKAVTEAQVAALARAFGMTETPRSVGGQWQVGDVSTTSGPVLRVEKQAPGAWTFTRVSPAPDGCTGGDACAPPPPVSAQAALRAAAPVLKAAGQDDAKIDADQLVGSVRLVNADPVIGGLPTYGWATDLDVGAGGKLTGGSGQLSEPVAGDTYPTIGAAEALERLNSTPPLVMHPGIVRGGAACVPAGPVTDAPPAATGCGGRTTTGGTATVSQAAFGLSAQTVSGQRALVPSWLFEVKAAGGAPAYTVPEPAIAPEYVRQPQPVAPVPSGPARPSAPSGQPSPLPDRQILSYSTTGTRLTVSFWGGVCGRYTASADESGSAVKVRITPPKPQPGPCVALAKKLTETITLTHPVGDRAVVNATSGTSIPKA